MDPDTRLRLRLLSRLEQLSAGLASRNSDCEGEARDILRRVVSKGSCAMLAHVFRGIVLAWDEEENEWERMA